MARPAHHRAQSSGDRPARRRAGPRGQCSRSCAPESAHQQRGESPRRTEHWLSVVEGNCVVERRGGEQPETNCQSINKTMLNTIRPDALASLRGKGEAQNGKLPGKGERQQSDTDPRRDSERGKRNAWVGGDRMAGSWSDMNQGSRSGQGAAFMAARRARRTGPEGDRASVVAQKRG
jgi:hypothetical protein